MKREVPGERETGKGEEPKGKGEKEKTKVSIDDFYEQKTYCESNNI